MPQKDNTSLMKVRYSIGAKLITIITFIVLMSLGSITILVSWLFRADLQISAEENNFETNRRSSIAAESVFENVISNSLTLLRTITAAGTESTLARDTSEYFFERNPQIASFFFITGSQSRILINESFLAEINVDPVLAEAYRADHEIALLRAAAGETILLNAAPYFTAPVLAMFFPAENGGCGVLFTPEGLNDSFGYGVNRSYMINDSDDILIHADFNLVQNLANIADRDFVRYIRNSTERTAQTLYTDEEGVRYFGAFTRLNTAGAVVITSIEYDKVFEGINATIRRNLYLTITVLSISIILIWFFAKSISIPIKELVVAARKIEGGSFSIALRPKGNDEIGVLTASFRHMCKALSIFGRFTHTDIALRAMRGEIKPGGSPKHATIFFSDIRDFTATSENFAKTFESEASDRIVQWLNAYFTKMVDCVEKTNGVVDKFIGDALMAHWGTVNTTGSARRDAYNCISAALMMRKMLYRMNKERAKDDQANPRIRIGCGINTGIVTAGQIGSDVRMEYTVTGSPVNLASRVESLNKVFGTDILIAEDTWRLVRKKFITEEMPSVTIMGKETPVRIFAVINYAKATKGPKSLTRLRRILGIKPPENLKLDANYSNKKYSIVGMK